MSARTSIAIVDNDPLILTLLGDFMTNQKQLNLLFTARSGNECLEKLLVELPEVILIDLKMQPMSGIELLEKITALYPNLKCIVFSSHYKKSFTGFMVKNGVTAFVPKETSPNFLLEIIEDVKVKGYYFLEEQMENIREQLNVKTPSLLLPDSQLLTNREIEVLVLICEQKTAKEIGERLFINQRTVEGHKNNLFLKTEAKNNVGLAIWAIKHGFYVPKD